MLPFTKCYRRVPCMKHTRKNIFIGYPTVAKGYRLHDPVKNKSVVRRHLTFNELDFKYRNQPIVHINVEYYLLEDEISHNVSDLKQN